MTVMSLQTQQHVSARHYLRHSASRTSLQASLKIVAQHFGFSKVQLNILDKHHQHTIVAVGTELGTVPREESLCGQVVAEARPKVLSGFSFIPESLSHIRSYIGVPITGREGIAIGALCLWDTVPRECGKHQLKQLQLVAAVIQDQLELLRRLAGSPFSTTEDAAELLEAVHSSQITPFYQPVIDLKTGGVVAVEALARWQHPRRGLLQPSSFVPLAEDSETIIDVDLTVLSQAAKDVAGWQRDRPGLRLNSNVSSRHFDHPDCVRRLTGAVLRAGLQPESVTLELTETAAMAAGTADRILIEDLRARGFRVVLDDFGTEFSTMEQILTLPIDGIKIDRKVAASLGTAAGNSVLRALFGLAADLRLDTVIEGVECPEQAAAALRMGCKHAQGYLWTKPIAATKMGQYLHIGAVDPHATQWPSREIS